MVALRSWCKINLHLAVLQRRDDGYHELETILQPLPLFDDLSVGISSGEGIEFSCSDPGLPVGQDNLVVRAVRIFREISGRMEGLTIRLDKRIPHSAGLGGGSGNAAAALLACNHLHQGVLDPDQLVRAATSLGMDVPFFLEEGPALATGRGERMERLAPFDLFGDACVVLVNPGFGVSTPWAYRNLRPEEDAGGVPARKMLDLLVRGDWEAAMDGMRNSLEGPVFRKYPVLAVIRDELLRAGARGALLSGSGATLFGIVRDGPKAAEAVRSAFLDAYGNDCWSRVLEMKFPGRSLVPSPLRSRS